MDNRVRRKSLAEVIWGWNSPPKPGYTLRQTWAWQLLEDQTSTCRPLGTARAGHWWDAGSGEGPRGGMRPEELSTTAVISYKQRPDFKDPPMIPQGPILSASYPSLPLKTHLSPRARGLRSIPAIPEGPSLASAATPQTGSSPTWVWSKRSCSALLHFILPEALATEIYYDVKR